MRLVVFDLDGTLIDSGAHISDIVTAAFAEEGLKVPTPEEAKDIIGLSLETALARLSGLSGAALDRLAATYRRIYHSNIGRAGAEPLYAGIREMLDRLQAEPHTLLAIATGKGLRGLQRVLDMHGIRDRFVTLQTPDDNPSKPDPSMLIAAMKAAGVGPDRTVMIGDTSYDMEMARSAGCFALGVTWGYHRPQVLRQAGAHALVVRVGNLDAAINSLVRVEADA